MPVVSNWTIPNSFSLFLLINILECVRTKHNIFAGYFTQKKKKEIFKHELNSFSCFHHKEKKSKVDFFFTLEMLPFSFKIVLYFTVSYNLNKSQKGNILKMKYSVQLRTAFVQQGLETATVSCDQGVWSHMEFTDRNTTRLSPCFDSPQVVKIQCSILFGPHYLLRWT